eukprot:4374000-Pleurochrysis_carterae.AAC.1
MDAWGDDSSDGERMLTPDSPDTSEPQDVPKPYDPTEPICPPSGPRLPPGYMYDPAWRRERWTNRVR